MPNRQLLATGYTVSLEKALAFKVRINKLTYERWGFIKLKTSRLHPSPLVYRNLPLGKLKKKVSFKLEVPDEVD